MDKPSINGDRVMKLLKYRPNLFHDPALDYMVERNGEEDALFGRLAGTLALTVLRDPHVMGDEHGYGFVGWHVGTSTHVRISAMTWLDVFTTLLCLAPESVRKEFME